MTSNVRLPGKMKKGASATVMSEHSASDEPGPKTADSPGETPEVVSPSEPITPTDEEIFGPLPALRGEGQENLKAILAALIEDVRPRDLIEKIFVHDAACSQFDLQRLRRLKSNVVASAKLQGARKVLADIDPKLNFIDWAERWVAGDPEAIRFISKRLAAVGLAEDTIADEAFLAKIDEIERIDLMIMRFELRRNGAFEEMWRHRRALAEQFRASAEEFQLGRIDYDPEALRRGKRR